MKKYRDQAAFFNSLDSLSAFKDLFKYLPDLYFFLFDKKGRIMALNNHFLERMGNKREADLLGKDSYDLYPADLAERYTRDNHYVLSTGKSILSRVELNQAPDGSHDWFITYKIPLRNKKGEICGIAGFARDLTLVRDIYKPYEEFNGVIDHIDANFYKNLTIAGLSKIAGLSAPSFRRRFKKMFNCSPIQYLTRVRIRKACAALINTEDNIAAIGYNCGFYDHSAFTRNFQKHMEMSPKVYRQRNRVV